MSTPVLTPGDIKLLTTVATELEIKAEGDWDKVKDALNHANVNVTKANWSRLLRKLKPDNDTTPKKKRKVGTEDDERQDQPKTPTSAAKRARKSPKKKADAAEVKDEPEDGEI